MDLYLLYYVSLVSKRAEGRFAYANNKCHANLSFCCVIGIRFEQVDRCICCKDAEV